MTKTSNTNVRKGKRVAANYPRLEVGNLLTYDRGEIEQLNNLRNVFDAYLKDKTLPKPLSVCVFGSPGAGKSFAVKEIASHLQMSKDSFLEFNLSQMESYADLAAAFHRIADAGLHGKEPLVFFDEFDCPKDGMRLGWLRNFLAPMQDGTYREGTSEYAIGRAVFVFAGGTSSDHTKFLENTQKDANAKGTDFHSRTKAFVDIVGINRPSLTADIPYVKRAILLRSLIMRYQHTKDIGQELSIDDKVINAFLDEETYHHDARSMEAIISTSDLCAGSPFTPACIVNNCLGMHVSENFNKRLQGDVCPGQNGSSA